MDKKSKRNLQKNIIVSKINKYLDELDNKIMESIGCMGYRLVNNDNISIFIQKIKSELPEEVDEAARVLAEKETIISEAQEKADNILERATADAEDMIAKAKEKAEEYVSETYIMKKATENANNIILDAQDQAKNAITYANNYVEGAFDSILKGIDYLHDETDKAKTQITERLDSMENRYAVSEETDSQYNDNALPRENEPVEDDEFSGYM